MTEYSLTPELAGRLIRAMQWVERYGLQDASGSAGTNEEVPNVQEVTVDDPLVKYVDGSFTYNAAHVEVFNADAGDLDTLGAVWLVEANERALVAGETYTAIQSGERTVSGDKRIVFATGLPCCVAPEAPGTFYWATNYWI